MASNRTIELTAEQEQFVDSLVSEHALSLDGICDSLNFKYNLNISKGSIHSILNHIYGANFDHSYVKQGYHRICPECGKDFWARTPNRKWCYAEHYRICPICGKQFKVTAETQSKQVCSRKCADDPKFKRLSTEKMKQTCLRKFGDTSFTRTQAYRDKTIQTNRERYGVDWSFQSKQSIEKRKHTLIEKYGVDNISKTSYFLKQVIQDPSKADNLLKFKQDPVSYITNTFDGPPTLEQLSSNLGIIDSSVGYILHQLHVPQKYVAYTYSRMENEVYDFLKSILPRTVRIERNTFQVITPYELDIYMPEYKLAIECNPTSTHNSSKRAWSLSDDPTPIHYHQMKTELCKKQGIFLFHLFGYEWHWKQDIMKSMICNLLHVNQTKIFARKTDIREVDYLSAKEFLNLNHRQGNTNSPIRLGLYYQDKLVSLMTFGKSRKTIGTLKNGTSDYEYELVRFCSKLNTTVVGGASKLFQYFIKHYNPQSIVSFSDRAHTKGSLYKMLGFSNVRQSDPSYVWVDYLDRAYNRVNAQKRNIQKFLKDGSLDMTKSEYQLMEEHNFVRVYDSGTITWKWSKFEEV